MSYCRFSSSNWQSDIYCYEHCYGGYQIHVAGTRLTSGVTPLDWSSPEKLKETHDQQMKDLDNTDAEVIGLEYDGQCFLMDDAEECLQMLRQLQEVGYNVPDEAMEMLAEEVEE